MYGQENDVWAWLLTTVGNPW